MCKFRCGNHKLPIVTGRYIDIRRENRKCTLCNCSDIADEYHFLFVCQYFNYQRTQLLQPHFRLRPNTTKMYELLNTKCKLQLKNLAKLIKLILTNFQ